MVTEAKDQVCVAYDRLRCDLVDLLMEHRSQGRFTRAATGTDEERSLFLAELTRSIADILAVLHPKTHTHAYPAALADAVILARNLLPTSPPPTNNWHVRENMHSSGRT